jgi:ketosteroid isomerase-like protein
VDFSREEIEEAFAEYRRKGAEQEDWAGWGALFTDDAVYQEHFLGTFNGREEITKWIVACMADYSAMSIWIEWYQIEGDTVAFYVWNNLPDPTGEGRSFQFPNTTLLRYGGDGKWSWEADYYNPADAERVFTAWLEAGGNRKTAQDRSLKGIAGWAPDVPTPAFPREEVERELVAYRERGNIAVATGDWNQWADQFTEDAQYLEHHYGKFEGREGIRAWILGVMQPFPTMEFPITYYSIEGNRVCALIPNILPHPSGEGEGFGFDVNTILHYAGNGKWSYEEDVYNPREAQEVVEAWIAAGGVMPTA